MTEAAAAGTFERQWGRLDAGVPLALLPVRLETRLTDSTIFIRIEPDVLHHDRHVRVLRGDERRLAEQFWADITAAGNHREAWTGPWLALAQTLGPWRAAWCARAVKQGVAAGEDRGRPPLARLLPRRWVAKAWFGEEAEILGWSAQVREPLPLGFDIDDPHWREEDALEMDERAGRLEVDPGARWMLSFEAAEAAGMGIRAELADHPALRAHLNRRQPIDELLVIGVDDSLGAEEAGARFADLLAAHRYSRGLELVPQGTPTNNTEAVRSGVCPDRPDLDHLLERELGPWLPRSGPSAAGEGRAPGPGSMGGQVARALGLDPADLVGRLEFSELNQERGAALMNRLLWPLAFGELLDTLLAGVAAPSTHRLVERPAMVGIEEWFCAQVRGGGGIGTLRLASQPFGVLPVRRLRRPSGSPPQGGIGSHVNDAVHLLRESWREVVGTVATMRPDRASGEAQDPQECLLKILGSQPHPWEFTIQRATDYRELLGAEYTNANWAVAQHVPMLAALMPNFRFGEPGRRSLAFIRALFGGDAMPAPNTADDFLALLVCWAKVLCADATQDMLPAILAAPSKRIAMFKESLEADWITTWNLDALRWQEALADKPLPPIAATLDQLIESFDWLLGNPNPLLEVLKPEGVWMAYHGGLLARKAELEAAGVQDAATGPGAELAFCRRMFNRIGDKDDQSIPSVLRQARAALELHRQRLAPMVPLFAHWDRSDRLLTHILHDGPTGAFLAYEDREEASWPAAAALVEAQDARPADQAATYLADLAAWASDAATDVATHRSPGMAPMAPPPLLFQLGRAAIAATAGKRQERIRMALDSLAGIQADELELRLRESIGLCTHRLDAWATGLASEALDTLRKERPSGLQIGAYGWVEKLYREEVRRESQGHLLAPSLAHAATAAVLREGWQRFGDDGAPHPGLAINLCSSRTRRGRWLLDGLRQGQALGDLLGYRFERGLHDHQLDRWIDDVRQRLVEVRGEGSRHQPVDGLELWNLWCEEDTTLKDIVGSEPRLSREFAALGADLDAILDLTTAEGVYQLVQGNVPRMAASLDALGLPDADPPECEFPTSSRPGRTITHRLLLSLPDPSPVPAGEGWSTSPRSETAPALERWARLALGPASRYRIVCQWLDSEGNAEAPNPPIDVSRLGLSALDAIQMVEESEEGGTHLRARLWPLVAQPSTGAGPWRLRVIPDARDGLKASELTTADLIALTASLRRLLLDGTPADAQHLCHSDVRVVGAHPADIDELVGRARGLAERLGQLAEQLEALLPQWPAPGEGEDPEAPLRALLGSDAPLDVDADRLRRVLLEIDRFAIEAKPLAGEAKAGDAAFLADRRRLLRQGLVVARALAVQTEKIRAASSALEANRDEKRVEAARRIFALALGREFPVLMAFRLPSVEAAAEVATSLAASGQRAGEGPGGTIGWLEQLARVRPRANDLLDVLLGRAATGIAGGLELHTIQLPHRLVDGEVEPWAARLLPSADQGPRLNVVCCGARPVVVAIDGEPTPTQALLIDQWSEVIPDSEQTAAVAFHFDAPASRPPQAVLLALPPEGRNRWTFDDVVDTVRETFEWARLRAVGPAELAKAGLNLSQYLPALYSPIPFEVKGARLQGDEGLSHRWRLEGKTTTEDLEPGIQARIADPLWMLARQWQVGEFQGEDSATPTYARIELETTPISSLRPEAGGNWRQPAIPLTEPDAIEVLTEAQNPAATPGEMGRRGRAGLRFMWMLEQVGLFDLADAVRQAFPLREEGSETELSVADQRQLAAFVARAPDGAALAAALRGDLTGTSALAVKQEDQSRFSSVARDWLQQWEADGALAQYSSGWDPSRLEYSLSVAAATADGELTLRAEEYGGGRLDWDSFDIDPRGGHGLKATPPQTRMYVRIPSPLRYAGMPADRWWEFEDGEVNFGAIQASPADLQRMLVAGFAMTHSDDWFSLPITLASGQLARVKSMGVIDSFGRRHAVASIAALDQAGGEARPWRLFELSGDPGPAAGQAPWLLLAPALPDALEGPPIEEVHMLRDETSNLVWAIERQVEGPLGAALDRVLAWKTSREKTAAMSRRPVEGRWTYEVAPESPPFQIPFVPERAANGQIRLRRGRLHQGLDESGKAITTGARGVMLNPGGADSPLRLFEEEVPRGGLQLTRAWQLARDREGRVWLWLGHRKRPGRPMKVQGVTFDRLSKGDRQGRPW